jgi:hypothetical protein
VLTTPLQVLSGERTNIGTLSVRNVSQVTDEIFIAFTNIEVRFVIIPDDIIIVPPVPNFEDPEVELPLYNWYMTLFSELNIVTSGWILPAQVVALTGLTVKVVNGRTQLTVLLPEGSLSHFPEEVAVAVTTPLV